MKFLNPSNFAVILKYSFNFPEWFSILTATLVPMVEILIGVSLILNIYRNQILKMYRLLLISFLVFHIWNIFVANQRPCDCFGNLVEFNSIEMMMLILVLLFLSFISLKSDAEKDFLNAGSQSFSKNNIVLIISIIILIIVAGYVRWVRIEKELNTGLISHTDLPEVEARLHSISNSYFSDLKNDKHTLLLFLRGKSCVSCIEELEFWKRNYIGSDVNIVGVFINITENDKKWFNEILKIPFEVRSLDKEIFEEIIGEHPSVVNRLLFTKGRGKIIAKVANSDEYEKKSFLNKILESIK